MGAICLQRARPRGWPAHGEPTGTCPGSGEPKDYSRGSCVEALEDLKQEHDKTTSLNSLLRAKVTSQDLPSLLGNGFYCCRADSWGLILWMLDSTPARAMEDPGVTQKEPG